MILESLRHDERPYFNVFLYTLNGVDLNRLHAAFDKLASVVQVLRTRFIQTDDGFAQVVLRHARLPWYDLSVSQPGQTAKAHWLDANSNDLLQPIEVHLLHHGSGIALQIFIHHALYDGISWNLLLECVAKVYRDGEVPDVGPNFTAALAHGPLHPLGHAKLFWQDRLSGIRFAPLSSSVRAVDERGTTVAVS